MRIGIIAYALGTRKAGVETYVRGLIEGLGRIDTKNHYVVFAPRDVRLSTPSNFTWRPSRLDGREFLRRTAYEQFAMPVWARRDRLDILHGTVDVCPLMAPCQTAVTVQDLTFLTAVPGVPRAFRLYKRYAVGLSSRKASLIIVPSGHVADELRVFAPDAAGHVRVVPLGVESRFRPLERTQAGAHVRRRYGICEDYLLYVGRIEPRKNLTRLIRAFAWAKSAIGQPVILVIAGARTWDYANALGAADAASVRDSVLFLDHVPAEDLPALYAAARAFLYLSLAEGFGLPPLEAMACGTPVVCSDIVPLRHNTRGVALLVPPTDVGAIRDAIIRILADGELTRRLSQEGPSVARQFTWETTAAHTLAAYTDAVCGS